MGSLMQAWLVAARILRELGRTRRTLTMWAAFPALMLLLFGLIYAGGKSTSASFDRTAPGILTGAALFFSCLGGPIATLVAERQSGTLRRLLLTPLTGLSYFLGVCLAFTVVAAGQAVVVFGVARMFGGRYHGSLLLGAWIGLLCVAAYVGLGFLLGTLWARRPEDVTGPVAAFGVPLLVLGGTFFSPSILPPLLFQITQFNPIFHMNQALKAVAAEGATAAQVEVHLWALTAFALVSMAGGATAYRRMLRAEQRQ
jgi:ABC-2 type transport system permease protein